MFRPAVPPRAPASRPAISSSQSTARPSTTPTPSTTPFPPKPLGGSAQVGLLRNGKETRVTVALESAPDVPRDELIIRSRSPFLGAKVANLSPALAEELRNATKSEGVAVIDVPNNSVAARYGFKRGDVIVTVNDQPIAKTRDLEKAAGEPARTWTVTILRGGQRISAEFRG